MPNWKLVITSGSDAVLNSLNVKTNVSASSFTGSFTGSLHGTASQAVSSSYALSASFAEKTVSTLVVTNNGASNYIIDGVAKPVLTFVPGVTYKFDTSGVVGSHPFRFSLTANGPTEYTYGVTVGANYTEIDVDYATSSSLFYYCTLHSGMGNQANTLRDENLIHNSQTSSMSVLSASYAYTASSATNAAQAISSSYAYTASSATNSQQAVSASYAFTASSAISSSYAYTASSATNANTALTASSADTFLVRNDITASSALITGTLTAQTLVVQTVTSSIVYSSGSNTFGSELTDRQTFTGSVNITGSLSVNGSEAILTNQTASMAVASAVSASYAYTASSAISASYAYTASSAISAFTASSAVSASQSVSSSYAYTASSAENAFQSVSSSFALTASYALNGGSGQGFPFSGSAQITGSLGVTGSFSVNGNTGQTIFASNADTLVISGSLIVTGSSQVTGSLNVLGGITGSLFGTSSQAVSSSYAYTASSAISASFALTASYALNAGQGGVSAIYILDEGVVQGTASYFDFTGAGVTATVNNNTASIYIPGGGGGSNTNSQNAILSQTSPAVTWSFTHNLSTLYPVFTIYDNEDNVIIPQKIHAETTSSAFIYFSSARTGTAVASKGGDITSASFAATASLAYNAVSASYAYTASSAVSASYSFSASRAEYATQVDIYVKNSSGAQINKGSVVRISGAVGDNPLISLADWTDDANSANTLGIAAQNIPNDSFGFVITEGVLLGVSTQNYTAGQLIYLASSGSITGSAPTAPLHAVRLGQVLRSQLNNGSIYVRIDNGYELGELHDVVDSTTTTSYGDLLVKSGSVWINSKQLTGSYALTGSLTVTGNITAQTLVVQTVTASVVYSSGSNTFGNDLSNRQTFTGSVLITGSLSVNDSNVILTNQTASMAVASAYTASSAVSAYTASSAVSASLAISSSVAYSGTGSFTGSFTGSLNGTASLATSASYAFTASSAISASYSYTASSAINASASLISVSSSYALTASYALNGGGGGVSAIYIQDEGITQGTASYFNFTGAGVTATVTDSTASINITGGGSSGTSGLSTTFTQSVAADTWTFVHNLNTRYPLIQVYDTTYNQVTPQYVSSSTADTVIIGFGIPIAGYAVASNGGTLYVTGSNVILDQAVAATTWSFNHNLNTQYPIFQVFDSTNEVVVPQRIVATDATSSLIYFPSPVAGKAVASVGGISGSMGSGVGFPFSGSAVITGSFLVSQSFVDFSNTTGVTGSFTGSLFGTASYATFALSASFAPGFTTNMSQSVAATTWSFTHNLNTITPIVQVYDLTNAQIIPNQIVGMNNSTAEIRFDYAQAGYAVASNGGGLYVTGSTSTLVQTAANVTWSFTHNLNNKYNTYEVYDSNDTVILPSGIKALTNNTAELYFAYPQAGRAVAQFSGINGSPNAATASFANTASFVSNLVQNVFITGSLTVTGSAAFTGSLSQNNGFVTLTQVSQSLNYADDTAAAAGGVPLGGLYRNGNFILIRLS